MEDLKDLSNPESFCTIGDRTQWGERALSSNVSKLVSKEVSKILRNFTLAPKKACHCEDERSEDVAIAKSLNINEITTQSSIARNESLSETNLTTLSLCNDSFNFPLLTFLQIEIDNCFTFIYNCNYEEGV